MNKTFVCLDCGVEYSQFQPQCNKCESTRIWDEESVKYIFGEDWRENDKLFKKNS
jgi:predicted ATP-dependent serine protease